MKVDKTKELEKEIEILKKEICNLRLGVNGDIQPTVFGMSLDEVHKILTYTEELQAKFGNFFCIDNQVCWDIAFLKDKYIRYCKALEEIERICLQDRDISDVCLISTRLETPRCKYDIQDDILDIINKAKRGK